jgi:leucyl-tRNA synthetase
MTKTQTGMAAPAVASSEATETPHRYTAALADEIEQRWQERWDAEQTFRAPNPVGPLAEPEHPASGKPKMFIMDMFPYPSGKGLHVGHPLGYIATDVVARFGRMCGKNVLHTMGYDAFGLPAEQYAVQTGRHPRATTEENIAVMRRQLRRLGLGHDQRRSFATIQPDYVRWTQWIFLQIFNSWYDEDAGRARPIADLEAEFASGRRPTPGGRAWAELDDTERRQTVDEHRLAYVADVPVNWCPGLGTVLANEEVTSEGRSERGNLPVFKRNLRQWMMRITAYADRLVDDLDRIDWPEKIKIMQRNWIGRSSGATIRFPTDAGDVEVFTTRPDTVFGATFMVVAPEHPLVEPLTAGPSAGASGTADDIGGSAAGPSAGASGTVDDIGGSAAGPSAGASGTVDDIGGSAAGPSAGASGTVDDNGGSAAGSWPDGTKDAWTGGHATPAEAVAAYRHEAASKSEVERQTEGREKTGVFTGSFATNPATGQPIPVFVADYVLMGYGTGAIMAVPGQDERDWEYAGKFDLPIVRTVQPPDDFDGEAYVGEGPAINSSNGEISLDGLAVADAKKTIIEWLEARGLGTGAITYRLRDWLFSRQRYWGEPFPIVYDEDDMPIALPDDMLPVDLPDVPDYSPKTFEAGDVTSAPEPPLARVPEWVNVELDLGDGPKTYRRDTNTMPNWAGSCWYHLRYIDPDNDKAVVDPENERYWMGPRDRPLARPVPTTSAAPPRDRPLARPVPTTSAAPPRAERSTSDNDPGGVDLYIGGVEHAVLHLLYARFWHKVLFDLGYVSSDEPYYKLFNQGYIQAPAYTDERGQYVPADEVTENEPGVFTWNGQPVSQEFGKIGKSLKNMVTPDEMIRSYGADTFRVYEMSMGPLDQSKPWETRAVVGPLRFLQRLWRNVVDEGTGETVVADDPADDETRRLLHKTIDAVRADMAEMRFNTAIARLIELNNHITKVGVAPREVIEPLVLMVAPIAPHIAEELWARLGHSDSLTFGPFPEADPGMLVEETVTCVVQVAGKVRDRLEVPPSADEATLQELALASEAVQRTLDGREVRKVIVRAPKLVNIVPA